MGKKKADAPVAPRQGGIFNRTGQNAVARTNDTAIARPPSTGDIRNTSLYRIFTSQRPGGANSGVTPEIAGMDGRYNAAADAATADYNKMMAGMDDWRTNSFNPLQASIDARNPHQFTYKSVGDKRSGETDFALKGYKDFAETGGYSPQDIQELRARGISPIRSVYANAMADVDRSTALQGGYGPNRIAAQSKMQRELPGQLADATTNVNAGLADAIRQGKLAGLGGVTGISEAEAGRRMQSQLANQGADLQSQGMTEDAYNAWRNQQMGMRDLALKGYGVQNQLYGTTPGMADMFGRQALSAQEMTNNYKLGLANNKQSGANSKRSMWGAIGSAALTAAPYIAMAMSDKNVKTAPVAQSDKDLKTGLEKINPHKIRKALRELPISKWEYKDSPGVKHLGPMAQDFKKAFGIGTGKDIHLVDVMGVMLASRKAELNRGKHG